MGSRSGPEGPRPPPARTLEAERARQATIRRIDAALARLAAGDYGYCADCGRQLATTLLDREPTTALCPGCAGGSC